MQNKSIVSKHSENMENFNEMERNPKNVGHCMRYIMTVGAPKYNWNCIVWWLNLDIWKWVKTEKNESVVRNMDAEWQINASNVDITMRGDPKTFDGDVCCL